MSRAKQIGTAAESIVVAVAKRNGFPHAKRVTLSGSKDQGDIHLGDGIPVILEVKGGKQTDKLTPGKVTKWLAETECERVNAGAEVGLLVTQRRGYGIVNAEKWDSLISAADWFRLVGVQSREPWVEMELGHALELIGAWHLSHSA